VTRTAAHRPCTDGDTEYQAKLFTNAGTASGAAISPVHIPRPGRSVLSTSHAAAVPSMAAAAIPRTVSDTVLTSSSPTRGRNTSATIPSHPTPRAPTTT
jgi:hypothetical protein